MAKSFLYQMAKKFSHLQMDIFCHFKVCLIRRNSFWRLYRVSPIIFWSRSNKTPMPSILGREMASIKYQFDTFFFRGNATASNRVQPQRASAEVLRALNLNFQHLYFPFFPPLSLSCKSLYVSRHTCITTNY